MHDATRTAAPRVAIAGATGYAGQELLRLLAGHPGVRVTAAMSSGGETRRLPALARIWDGDIQPLDVERLAARRRRRVSRRCPRTRRPDRPALVAGGVAGDRPVRRVPPARRRGSRKRWYPGYAALPAGHGLRPDRAAAARRSPARPLVSCPGCYPTAALLALAPLADAGLLDGDVIIDAKSGVSGAGKTPTERTHFSESPRQRCRPTACSATATRPRWSRSSAARVTFVPHLVPLNRGILETIYVARSRRARRAADVGDALRGRVHATRRSCGSAATTLPEIKHVAYTNFCDIGWRVDEATGRLVIVSCIDNLVKGAAGQAVQNLNLMCGLDERTGLLAMSASPTVLKLGGELLEDATRLRAVAAAIAARRRPDAAGRRARRRAGDRRGARGGRHREAAGRRPARHRRRHARASSSPCWPAPSIRGSSRPSPPPAGGPSA